jgi:hypothetical protein
MTGFDLWATYPTVTGAAHYDLSHSPAEHTVSALLMVWDGTGTDTDVWWAGRRAGLPAHPAATEAGRRWAAR